MTEVNDGFIYLRPDGFNTPISYLKSIEKAGLAVNPDSAIGIYVAGMGPIGPQGPAGADGADGADGAPYLDDTIIASCSDEYSPLEVDLINPAVSFRASFPLSLTNVRINVVTAPIGADIICDVHMNGSSIFTGTSYIHITDGSKTSVGSATPYVLAVTAVPDDALFEVFITQVGNVVAGTGLKINLTGEKQVA